MHLKSSPCYLRTRKSTCSSRGTRTNAAVRCATSSRSGPSEADNLRWEMVGTVEALVGRLTFCITLLCLLTKVAGKCSAKAPCFPTSPCIPQGSLVLLKLTPRIQKWWNHLLNKPSSVLLMFHIVEINWRLATFLFNKSTFPTTFHTAWKRLLSIPLLVGVFRQNLRGTQLGLRQVDHALGRRPQFHCRWNRSKKDEVTKSQLYSTSYRML